MTRKIDKHGYEKVEIPFEDMHTNTGDGTWTSVQYEYRLASKNETAEKERQRVRAIVMNAVWPATHEAPRENRVRLVSAVFLSGVIGFLLGSAVGITAACTTLLYSR